MRKIKGKTDNETQVKITRQLNGRKIEQDVNQREDKILQDDQSKTGDAKATDHERDLHCFSSRSPAVGDHGENLHHHVWLFNSSHLAG